MGALRPLKYYIVFNCLSFSEGIIILRVVGHSAPSHYTANREIRGLLMYPLVMVILVFYKVYPSFIALTGFQTHTPFFFVFAETPCRGVSCGMK